MNKNILCIIAAVFTIILLTVLDSRGQGYTLRDAAFVGAAGFSAASGGGGSPAWGGPVNLNQYGNELWSSSAASINTILTLSNGISSGRLVMAVSVDQISGTAVTLSGVTDSAGNTWTVDVATNLYNDTYQKIYIASANVGAPLAANSRITNTWSSADFASHVGALYYIAGVASVDITAQASAYGTTPGVAATTTATGVCFGVVGENGTGQSISSLAWDAAVNQQDTAYSNRRFYIKKATSAGSQNPAVNLSGANYWAVAWVGYK